MVSGVKKSSAHILLIIAIGLLAYSNTFHIPFQFDDEMYISGNPFIQDSRYLFDSSEPDVTRLKGYYLESVKDTRYLGYLTFFLNYSLHGMNVAGYHAVNIAIHLINAVLIYGLVLTIFRSPYMSASSLSRHKSSVALVAALLFVAHPSQTEAVTYVSQRFTSLATTFYILATIAYGGFRTSDRRVKKYALYVLCLVSAFAAMKTKEISFTLPLAVILMEFMLFSGPFRQRLLVLVPIALMLFVVPFSVVELEQPLGQALDEATKTQDVISRHDYLVTQIMVVVTYLRLIILPLNLNLDYDYPVYTSFYASGVLASGLLISVLLGSVFFAFARLRHRLPEIRIAVFGVLWFFLTLLVESSFIALADMIFEHRLYLPSAGAFIFMATVLFITMNKYERGFMTKVTLAACALMVLSFVSITHARNNVWASRTSLWEDVVKKSPGKLRGYFNLGVTYQDAGFLDKAIGIYKKALEIRPYNPDAHNNLGKCYASKGLYDLAIKHYRETMKLRPDNAAIYNDLGICYKEEGLPEEAIKHYRQALRLQPNLASTHFNLGNIFLELGETDRAIEHYQQALRIKPDMAEAHNNLGNSYFDAGQTDKAMQHFKEALNLKPDLLEARNNMGNVYFDMGETDVAIEHFKSVVQSTPSNADAQFNLGLAYLAENDTDNAIRHFQKALHLRPLDPGLHFKLGRAYFSGGMTDKAIEYYQTAIRLKPDFADAHVDLARLYEMEGLENKAAEHLKMAREIDGAIRQGASR